MSHRRDNIKMDKPNKDVIDLDEHRLHKHIEEFRQAIREPLDPDIAKTVAYVVEDDE